MELSQQAMDDIAMLDRHMEVFQHSVKAPPMHDGCAYAVERTTVWKRELQQMVKDLGTRYPIPLALRMVPELEIPKKFTPGMVSGFITNGYFSFHGYVEKIKSVITRALPPD